MKSQQMWPLVQDDDLLVMEYMFDIMLHKKPSKQQKMNRPTPRATRSFPAGRVIVG